MSLKLMHNKLVGMEIKTTSLLYPQSNRLAEKAVSTQEKRWFQPIVPTGYKLAELLQSRKLIDNVPVVFFTT